MSTLTGEDLLRATARARDRLFADLVTVVIGLAAETNPELLRTALGKVFNLSAVEETTQRMMNVVSAAQQAAQEARCLVEQVHLDLEALEQRIDALHAALEAAEVHPVLAQSVTRA